MEEHQNIGFSVLKPLIEVNEKDSLFHVLTPLKQNVGLVLKMFETSLGKNLIWSNFDRITYTILSDWSRMVKNGRTWSNFVVVFVNYRKL